MLVFVCKVLREHRYQYYCEEKFKEDYCGEKEEPDFRTWGIHDLLGASAATNEDEDVSRARSTLTQTPTTTGILTIY